LPYLVDAGQVEESEVGGVCLKSLWRGGGEGGREGGKEGGREGCEDAVTGVAWPALLGGRG